MNHIIVEKFVLECGIEKKKQEVLSNTLGKFRNKLDELGLKRNNLYFSPSLSLVKLYWISVN